MSLLGTVACGVHSVLYIGEKTRGQYCCGQSMETIEEAGANSTASSLSFLTLSEEVNRSLRKFCLFSY